MPQKVDTVYNMFTGPNTVTDGLVLALDAANTKSYPGSGTTWNDLSGNGNNGTLINSSTFDANNNGSIVFDGVDDYVNIPQFVSTSQNMTFSLWFNPSILPASTGKSVIFLQTEGGYTIRLYANTNFSPNNLAWLIYFERENATVGAVLPQYTYPLNIWTNTVMTFNENGQYVVYINGELWNTTNTITFVRWFLPTGYLRLSNSAGGVNGNISEFKIYDRTLSTEEVFQNFNATKSRYGL
jgi:hypothetical protein